MFALGSLLCVILYLVQPDMVSSTPIRKDSADWKGTQKENEVEGGVVAKESGLTKKESLLLTRILSQEVDLKTLLKEDIPQGVLAAAASKVRSKRIDPAKSDDDDMKFKISVKDLNPAQRTIMNGYLEQLSNASTSHLMVQGACQGEMVNKTFHHKNCHSIQLENLSCTGECPPNVVEEGSECQCLPLKFEERLVYFQCMKGGAVRRRRWMIEIKKVVLTKQCGCVTFVQG